MNEADHEMSDLIATLEPDSIERIAPAAMAVITSSEVTCQLDAAHRYPRSVKRFVNEAMGLATITRHVAESCIYSIPRDGKLIAGPSVRLAEICASAYGNLHAGTRVVDQDDKTVTAQGVVWDLERNLRVTVETKRRITGKTGRRFSDDMIVVTGNAASSIALRNAIFRVIPRAYVDTIYARVREVAVGDAKTLTARRDDVLQRLVKIGVPMERSLAKVGRAAPGDVTLDDVEILIGLGTAIKNGEAQIDEVFPAPTQAPAPPEQDGKRIKMGTPTREPGEAG